MAKSPKHSSSSSFVERSPSVQSCRLSGSLSRKQEASVPRGLAARMTQGNKSPGYMTSNHLRLRRSNCMTNRTDRASDDCAEGIVHALTCSPDSTSDRLACGECMCERRSLPCSRVFESYGLDSATEDSMPLLQTIECGVQLRDNRVGFIRD